MAASGSRSRVVARTARPDDLPAVLALVRQYRTDALAEGVLSGQTPLDAAAGGFRRLLADPGHRVVLAVLPGAAAPAGHQGADGGEVAVGLAILGTDPLSTVLGSSQVTVDTFVVHRAHRRKGAGAALLGAAAAYAQEVGAAHLVAAVGGHEAERQRFLARMGFAPLTARRIVAVETLARSLASWRRGALAPPLLRRAPSRRRSAPLRGLPTLDTLAAEG